MPRFRTTALAALASLLLFACSGDAGVDLESIRWRTLAEGLQEAKQVEKKVLVYFRADWCRYCKKLDRALTGGEIRPYLESHFIPVLVDFDREKEAVRRFGVRGVPDVWFLDSGGGRIRRATGFVSEKTFLSVLRYIASDAYRHASFRTFAADDQNR